MQSRVRNKIDHLPWSLTPSPEKKKAGMNNTRRQTAVRTACWLTGFCNLLIMLGRALPIRSPALNVAMSQIMVQPLSLSGLLSSTRKPGKIESVTLQEE